MGERLTERKEWDFAIKNAEGEIETRRLTSEAYEPAVERGDFIRQAQPTIVRPTRRRKPVRTDELTIAIGDAQIGYRGQESFHNETSMALAQIAIRELMPDRVLFLGDMIDLAPASTFAQRPDWQNSTQASIDRYHAYLAETRANAPNAEIVTISGNHELRMDKMIRRDAAELLGIRRANAEKELGVLTMGYLMRMGELGITNIDGYPNAAYWLNDNLKATHGTNVAKGGSNAAKYLREEDTGTLYGHTHRLELAYRTIPTRTGSKTIVAASPGCLAKTDGSVPGYRYSVDDRGDTVHRSEDWQGGLLVIENSQDNYNITPAIMQNGGVNIWGKRYEV